MIELSLYSRRDLSNLLQIAQQCDNAGHPLPCWLVEQLAEAHDALLPPPSADHAVPAAQPARPAPPCKGCTAARWIKFPCGEMGWECEGKQNGKCGVINAG